MERVFHHEGLWYHIDVDGGRCCVGVNENANPDSPVWDRVDELWPVKLAEGEKRKVDDPQLLSMVANVYRTKYWESSICMAFDDYPTLRTQVFDMRVRTGIKGPTWRLQTFCFGLRSTQRDGKWGPATKAAVLAKVAEVGEIAANNELVDIRNAFIERATNKGQSPKNMRRGLLARSESFRIQDGPAGREPEIA